MCIWHSKICDRAVKKILIANVLGELIGQFQASEEKSVLFFWMYAVAFMLQIYFDFPGTAIWRSDWELFLDLISGKLPLSLLFCEHYRILAQMAYFTWRMVPGLSLHPAGRQSCKTCAVDLQYFLVWMATGFWHGAAWNFILWGLMYAVLLLIEKHGCCLI